MQGNQYIRFHVDMALEGGALVISYSVENTGQVPVYLTNHAVRLDPDKGQVPDPSVVFVYVDPERDALHVTKRLPPPPETLTDPLMHFITPVSPGQTYTERLVIPLPVRTYAPYQEVPRGAELEQRSFSRVYFSLGYINGQPGLRASEGSCQGEKVYSLAPVIGQDGRPVAPIDTTEHYLYSRIQRLKVPVLIYKSPSRG